MDALTQLENQVLVAQSVKKTSAFLPMLAAFETFNSALKKVPDESEIVAIRFLDNRLYVTLKASPEHFKKWPKTGVLEAKFVYETKAIDNTINVIVSSQEAR